MQLTLNQLLSWFGKDEKLIPIQTRITATLEKRAECIVGGCKVKIICRIKGNRYAITDDLAGDHSKAIVPADWLKNIHVE